jgi:hypothetical protein
MKMQAAEVLDPKAVIASVMVLYCPPVPTDRHPLGGVVRLAHRAWSTENRHINADDSLSRENLMASRLPDVRMYLLMEFPVDWHLKCTFPRS